MSQPCSATESTPPLRGYRHAEYAESLQEFGVPRRLVGCQGSVIERQIPGTSYRDAIGCYPLFACADWSRLPADLEAMSEGLVTISLVPDPFGQYRVQDLKNTFDVVTQVKEYFVTRFDRRLELLVSAHHRRKAQRALRHVVVDQCEDPLEHLDDWCRLYEVLVERHRIGGISRFSRGGFATQLRVPGIVMFRATRGGQVVGLTLWFVDGAAAYYHLGAYSVEAYRIDASFAMFWAALDALARSGVEAVFLGGGAGASSQSAGLVRFKRGWATGSCPAYFCGKVLAPDVYAKLASSTASDGHGYFPAYRVGEFR